MEIPKYAMCGPPYNKSAKTMQPIHSFTKLKFDLDDVENNYNGIIRPLKTLDRIRDDDPELSLTSLKDQVQDAIPLERPVTPINDEIKAAPTSVTELGRLVRRRIVAKPENDQLTEERQKELAAIIMGEVNWAWNGLKTIADDPFLTPDENRELHRRVTVHFVTVCQDLFLQYIEKFSGLNLHQIFSDAATMTRLKAQLMTEVRAHLEVHRIRRNILESYKRERITVIIPEEPITEEILIADDWLQQAMPTLDSSHLDSLLAGVPKKRLLMAMAARAEKAKMAAAVAPECSESEISLEPVQRRKLSHIVTRDNILLKKAISSSDLTCHVTLLQELGLKKEEEDKRASESHIAEHFAKKSQGVRDDTQAAKTTRQLPTRERSPVFSTIECSTDFINKDLSNLMREPCDDGCDELTADKDDSMPALLQAVIRSSRHDGQLAKLQAKLTELKLMEKRRREMESVRIQAPPHVQPKTTSSKMNNQEIRTSDSRVSDRVCLSNVTLEQHSTVYNDLVDEVNATTIKRLDSNLFLGDEITEVYSEIMKTVSKKHMQLEDDSMVVHSPLQINHMDLFGLPKTTRRITNPELRKHDAIAPWGSHDRALWLHTPTNPPKDQKGRPLIIPMSPRGEGTTPSDLIPPHLGAGRRHTAEDMGELIGRTKKNWLNWWKTTHTTEDYLKYLSTQETDYMDTIFHLYDSIDENEELDAPSAARLTVESALSKTKPAASDTLKPAVQTVTPSQKGKRLVSAKELVLDEMHKKRLQCSELKMKKAEFHAGFWNTNTIFMGGLGKEPVCEEDDQDATDLEPIAEERPQAKVVDLKVKLVSKKAQRLEVNFKEEEAAKKSRHGVKSGDRPVARSASRHTTTESVERSYRKDERAEDEVATVSVQDRLEMVWTTLQMPDKQRLDMAIKYSSDEYKMHMDEVLAEWENVSSLIQQRETLVNQLEHFEKTASDPNRFFEIGYRGSAVARLNEARVRSTYYRKLEPLDKKIKTALDMLMRKFKDTVTYQGRCYVEKMKWDRTEMLYWLQEERKQQAIILENTIMNMSTTTISIPRQIVN